MWKQEVLSRIKPAAEEEKALNDKISDFLSDVNRAAGDAQAILGGSGAKGTWLKGQHDADIFVLFPYEKYKERSDQLAEILEKRLKNMKKRFQRLHGSRDYFRFKERDFIFEAVPILKINNARDAVNITDVSPLHARWVKSKRNIADEIRLAKAFCKAQRCYGAESYIRGFSGYVLEILVIYYGSFEKLLKAAVKWEEKQVIDADKLYKREEVWMAMNKAKLHSPLIVVDPVDKSRNAAAALSKEKWLMFKKKAATFLKKPSAAFFERKEVHFDKLKGNVIWIEVEGNEGKEDKVGAQLLLAFEFLKKKLKNFSVTSCGWEWNKKAVFWFVVKKKETEKFELRKGPPLELEQHVAMFKKKHKKCVVKKGVVFAKLAVKHYKLKDFVKGIVKEAYFKEKVKRVVKINIR